ncbi:hypothetical protein OROGR_013519 [Orobanche gracilis]
MSSEIFIQSPPALGDVGSVSARRRRFLHVPPEPPDRYRR